MFQIIRCVLKLDTMMLIKYVPTLAFCPSRHRSKIDNTLSDDRGSFVRSLHTEIQRGYLEM